MAPATPPLCRTTSEAAEKVASHVACALVGMYTLMMHGGIERKRKRMRDVSTIAMREWAVVRGAIALQLWALAAGTE